MTTYTLLENPNPHKRQFRFPRREQPSGVIVVHSAENVPDLHPPDNGAEHVADYISTRTNAGSYHALADSDSRVHILPPEYEAWQDGTGSNPHAWAVSGAFKARHWRSLPKWWRDGCVANMAGLAREYADWIAAAKGIYIPARRISRQESEDRVPGFISHAERDPGRRSDPGAWFPWEQFFDHFAMSSPQPERKKETVDALDALFKEVYGNVDELASDRRKQVLQQRQEIGLVFETKVTPKERVNGYIWTRETMFDLDPIAYPTV